MYSTIDMEQFIFTEETIAWLKRLCENYSSVAGVFIPSLLNIPNVKVYDMDPKYSGDNYVCGDLARSENTIHQADLYILDPPFNTFNKKVEDSVLLKVFQKIDPEADIIIVMSNYLASKGVIREWIKKLHLKPYREFIPTYQDIGNSYVDYYPKERGLTSILFWSNFCPYEIDSRLFSIEISDGEKTLRKKSVIIDNDFPM